MEPNLETLRKAAQIAVENGEFSSNPYVICAAEICRQWLESNPEAKS